MLVPSKRDFKTAIKEIENAVTNLKAKKCIYNFSNYIYGTIVVDDTEELYIKILKENLYKILETLIIKHMKSLEKSDIIKLYIDLVIYEENKPLKDWNAFDLELLINKFYDEEEVYPLIKTYMHNCLIKLKNDSVQQSIDDFEKQLDEMDILIKNHNKNIDELKETKKQTKKVLEQLKESIIEENIYLSLKETKVNSAVQTDDPTEGHKTQITQTDGAGKDDIVTTTSNVQTDTSDLPNDKKDESVGTN